MNVPGRLLSGDLVLKGVAMQHGVTVAALKSNRRFRSIAWPRQEAMRVLYDDCGWKLEAIAALLGNRDHTTIVYGIRRARARLGEAA